MKKWPLTLLMSACCLSLIGSLAAEANLEPTHIPIGLRPVSKEAFIEHEKARAENAVQNVPDIGLSSEQTPEPQIAATTPEPQIAATTLNAMKALKPGKMTMAKSMYYTSHPGAYHTPIAISFFGDSVETEDGAIWTIRSNDVSTTLNWFATDLLVITPNHDWFSSYTFRLTNQNTGESVAANLYLGPIYNGIFTHWITAIDYYSNAIYLEDGSIWSMSLFDDSVINSWVVNDTVIIGVNDGWLSSTRPNILINVNTLNFASGWASY